MDSSTIFNGPGNQNLKYRTVYQYSSRYLPFNTLETSLGKYQKLSKFATPSTSSSRHLQDSKSVWGKNSMNGAHSSAFNINLHRDSSGLIDNSIIKETTSYNIAKDIAKFKNRIKILKNEDNEPYKPTVSPLTQRVFKPWENFRKVQEFTPIRCKSALSHRNSKSSPAKSKSPVLILKSSKNVPDKKKLALRNNRITTRPRAPTNPTTAKPNETNVSFKYTSKNIQDRKQLKEMIHTKETEAKLTLWPDKVDGVIQLSLSFKNQKETIQDDQLNQRVKDKLQSLKAIVDKQLEEPISLDISEEWEKHDQKMNKITEYSVKFIKEQFSKPPEDRDYEILDSIFKKLLFFQRFPYHVRVSLINKATLESYDNGTVIFRQGEAGDNMFVIIRGCVAIKKKTKDITDQEIYVNSLYDGAQFGELALISSNHTVNHNNLRRATCIAGEDTILLAIPKMEYHEILLKELHHDIESKIKFFTNLPLFKGLDVMDLIPLATALEPITYRHNEVILPKGKQPEGLYLISSGHCTAYTEGFTIRRTKGDQYSNARVRKPSPRKFITGKTLPNLDEISKFEIQKNDPLYNLSNCETLNLDEDKLKAMSKFISQTDLDNLGDDKHVLKQRIPFVNLNTGDFFGGRALIEGSIVDSNYYLDPQGDSNFKVKESYPSKFSIIAEASEVKIFIITKHHINYLNEKEQIKAILSKSYEIDSPEDIDPELMDKLFLKWQSFKEQYMNLVRLEKFVDRRRGDYPYVRD